MHSAKLTRRELLRMSGGALLAAGLWPGRLDADDAGGEFRFAVANDLHYWNAACGKWLEREVIAKITADKPAFCLLAGDLGNAGKRKELEGVRDVFKTLGAPVHAVIGNHDWKTD
jgi:predicted MPP superfamily phosphohydrolase